MSDADLERLRADSRKTSGGPNVPFSNLTDPEPEPQRESRPPDRLLPGVILEYTDNTDVRGLSPLDRILMNLDPSSNYTLEHPQDTQQRSRLWLPFASQPPIW